MKAMPPISKPLSLIGFAFALSTFAFCAAGSDVALAVDACNELTGSVAITLLTNSDTFVSIPYTRAPLFCGVVQTATNGMITVQGAPGWANSQWSQVTSNGYFPNYVVLSSGTKEGATFVITNNSSDALFTQGGGCDDLSGVSSGDLFAILPYWTLGTIFPEGSGITPSTSSLPPGRKTQVLLPYSCPHCSGRPATGADSYFFYNSKWRKVGLPTTSDFNDVVILPDQFFIVRQSNNSPTTMLTAGGYIAQYTTRTCLYADNFTTNWDNYVANYHSTTRTLDQVNLAAAFAVSDPGTNPPAINDLLLVYDNAAMKINKAPAHVYFYYIDHWADLNNPPYSVNRGGDPVFVPGTGVTVRKRPGNTLIWVNPP